MKKIFKNVKKAAVIFAASISAIIIAGSCEIGLGASVDVYAPIVQVTYPPQGSIIQDEFVLAGTWEDDTSVTKMVVELTRTDTDNPVKYGPFDVVIDSENKHWQTIINEKKQDGTYTLQDGSYAADIYGYDTAGRKSNVASNNFDIDNTAPVLTLSKPVTFGNSSDTQLFGRQIKIGGDIVEKHSTRKLVISIKNENDISDGSVEPIIIEIEDVKEMSSDSPLVIARYNNSGDELDKNYKKIYGNDASNYTDIEKNGTQDKDYRCTFKLYDDAKEYKTPFPSGDGRSLNPDPLPPVETGNTSTTYFVGAQELSESITDGSSKFKLNPGNNPTYSIGGFVYPSTSESKTNNFRNISLGSQVTLQVQSGSDKGFIVPSETKVVAKQVKVENGSPVKNQEGELEFVLDGDVVILEKGEWVDSDANTVSKNLDINADKGLKANSYYIFDVNAEDRDSNKAIAYNGLDEIMFGFFTSQTSNPPTLTIDNKIKDKYYSGEYIKNTGLSVPFKVKTEGIPLVSDESAKATALSNQIKIKTGVADVTETGIDIKDTATTSSASADPKITKPTDYSNSGNFYTFEDANALKIGGTGNSDTTVPTTPGLYKYNFYLEATDSNNKSGSDLFTFYVDNKNPEISSVVVANNNFVTEQGDANKYLNGNITVNVTVSDNYKIKQTKYWVYAYNPVGANDAAKYHLVGSVEKDKDENNNDKEYKTILQNQNFSIDINTTDKAFTAPNNTLLIKFEVEDAVGNKKEQEETIGIVDQTKDKPKISFDNFTDAIASQDAVVDFFAKGSTLYGNVTDDDGLVSDVSTLVIKDKDGNIVKEKISDTETKEFSYPIVDDNKKVFKNITLPSAAGFYQVVVDVKDSKYKDAKDDSVAGTSEATIQGYRSATTSTWIAVDNDYPTIEVSATQKNGEDTVTVFEKETTEKKYNNGKDLTFTIELKDDLQLAKTNTLEIKVNDSKVNDSIVKTETLTEDLKTKTFTWKFELSKGTYVEQDYKIDFIVKDFSGKETTISRTVCKDKTPPTFAAGTVKISDVPAENLVNGWYNITTLPIEGAASDPSGVTKVQYTTGPLTEDDSTTWKTFAGTETFGTTISNLTNGSYIYFRATDGAENTTPYKLSEITTVTKIGPLQIDVDKPTVLLHNEAADPANDTAVYKYATEEKPADPKPDNRTWNQISNNNIISNGLTPIVLKLDLSDSTSGVQKLVLRFGSAGNKVYEETFATAPTSPYEVTIPAAKLESGTIWAEVTDNANNVTNKSLNVSVTFDNKYPEAKISKIKYSGTETELKSSKANKLIKFEGTATDDQQLVSIQLRYKKSTDSDWKNYGTALTSDIYNWTIEVDTTTLDGYADGVDYDFRVIGTDAAGNTGNSNATVAEDGAAAFDAANNKQITIDEASDRPTITLTNIDFATTMAPGFDDSFKLRKQNTIYVSVEDDDGDVTKIEWTNKATPAETDWKKITDNNFTLEDGAHTVSFRVTDAQGTSFVSGPKDTTNNVSIGPYLKSKSGNEPSSEDTRLYIVVDIKGPNVMSPTYASKTTSGQNYAASDYKESQSSVKLGGDYGYLGLKFSINDENGVESVQIKLGDKVIASETDSSKLQKGKSAPSVWEFKDIPLTYTDRNDSTKSYAFADGANVITVISTDYMGNTDESSYTINVDKSEPEISVDSHKNGDLVGNAFTLKGYISGKDSETNVKFFVDNNATVTETASNWTTANATEVLSLTESNWRLVVDGIENASTSQETHTKKSHKEMFVDVYGDSEKIELNDVNTIVYKNDVSNAALRGTPYRTVKPLYFHFLATDAVGNKKVTNLQLQIDPQGDLPSVKITYPVNAATGIEKVNGKIFVQGKAVTQGINTIEGVYLQIDPVITDNNGVYTFNSSKWESSTGDAAVKTAVNISALNDDIVNLYDAYNAAHPGNTKSTNLYGIKVSEDANWNTIINTNGELNGAAGQNRKIGLRVYVVDSAGNISIANGEDDVFLEIDANAPTIGENGRLYVKQYRWIDTSVTPNVTYYVNTHDPDANTVLYTDAGCRTTADNNKKWSDSLTSATISKDYEDNMWLSGEWWLTGPVVDASGISSIVDSLAQTNAEEDDTTSGYVIYSKPDTYGNKKSSAKAYTADDGVAATTDPTGFWFNYRIGSIANSHGVIKYKLVVKDNDTQGQGQAQTSAPLTSTKDISVRYDNVAPAVKEFTDDELARLRAVRNNNGFYQFSLEADEKGETQSGFARTVFYFERTTTHVIYDDYLKKSDANNNVAKTSLAEFDGLFWREGTISAKNGLTVTLSADVSNIHGGGLVKLGSDYFIVQSYNSSTKVVTLNGTPDSSISNGTKIYFAIGNVIDNESEGEGTTKITADEGYGYFDLSTPGYTAHDKDYMVESAVTTNGVTACKGSINSVNIRDGGVIIHYAVFDNAGNITSGTITDAVVENNAPRLAGLTVWCDNNDDGIKDADELKSRYSGEAERYSNSTTKMARATTVTQVLTVSGDDPNNSLGILHKNDAGQYDATPFMTIKGKVRFIPEIIGGNDYLYYRYMWGASSDFAAADGTEKAYADFGTTGTAKKATSGTVSIGSGNENTYNVVDHFGDSYINGTLYENSVAATATTPEIAPIEIPFATLSGLGNVQKWFKYEIWDSTESATPFSNGNLNTTFSVYLDLQCNDVEKPTVTINNFDFQDSTHNSVYRSDLSNGHIDFNISDTDTSLNNIKNVNVTQTGKNQKTFGADPKVSGIITIRGTAKDNIALSQLKMRFPTHTNGVDGKGIGNLITVASYTKVSGETTYSWKPVSSDYSDVAAKTYDSNKTNMQANGWTFDVWDDYFNEDGHQVSWECSIDTTKVTNLAQLDVLFQVQAIAKNGAAAYKTSVDTTKSMDVVPYITRVTTDLSKLSSTTPTMYSRTALGHYPINGTKGESVKVYGFNLKHDTGKDYVTIIPSSGASNEIGTLVKTNGIPVLNNLNNNNAAGYTTNTAGTKTYVTLTESNAETYGYNRQPNNKNNNRLDDDVVFDVWSFNSEAVVSISGASGSVDNAVMKINPQNKNIGFAFSNGSERFSMPGQQGTTIYSYYPFNMTYDYMKHNALHYDSFGNAYGCTVGGDIASGDTADMFSVMTSGKGPAPKDYGELKYSTNYAADGNHWRVETIGLKGSSSTTKNKDRFQSQSFATYSFPQDGKNYSHVYLAYYDLLRKQVKLKSGLYNNTDNTFTTIKSGTNNQFANHFGGAASDDMQYCQVIAGTVNGNNTLGEAGKYVAVGVTKPEAAKGTQGQSGYVAAKTETVVLVWYDGQNLKYTYKTDAANGKVTATVKSNKTTYSDVSDWATAETLLPNSGQYCQLYVDPNNGIHVAAYSNSGKLEYAYIPKYDQFAAKKTVVVDGFNDVGSYLTLDVAGVIKTVNGTSKTYYVPHIGYAGAFPEKPRYAYMSKPEVFFENTDTNTISGLVDKKYTQVWECSIVPTTSSVVKQRQINIGVWKNANGILTYSTTNGNAPGTSNIGTTRTAANDGLVYGNGTKNAVLGYVVSKGGSSKTVETAQKVNAE